MVRKCVLNKEHAIVIFLSYVASCSKLVSIISSEVSSYLVRIAAEDLRTVKSCVDECIRFSCSVNEKEILSSCCGCDATVVYVKLNIGCDSDYRSLTVNANEVSIININCSVCCVQYDCSCEGVTCTVNGEGLTNLKHACVNVSKEYDCVACLCCCESISKSSISYAVYRSNSLYDAVISVTVRYASHILCTVFGNVGSECTTGDCGNSDVFIVSAPSASPNVTVEGTAGYRSCERACCINACEVGRTVYNNVAADCNLHTACITNAVKIDCFNACCVFRNLTAGDIKLTLISRAVGILEPNLTYDLTAANIDNVIICSAVCKSTDGTTLSRSYGAALNVENCIAAVAVGNVVNSELVNIGSSGKALNVTTLNGESSLLVRNCSNCISPSSVCSTVEVVRNLTAAYAIKDSEVAVIFNKCIVLSDLRCNGLAKSIAAEINSEILIDYESRINIDVAFKNDGVTVLSILKSSVDRILTNIVNCGGGRCARICCHSGKKSYALCTGSKLVGVSAVIRMICRVEVLEDTTGNGDYTKNTLSLVNVEEIMSTLIEFLRLVVATVDYNRTTASCINCCTSVRDECTVFNSNCCAVDRGDNLNVLAVTCCKHSAVTCDSKLSAILSKDNLNYLCIKACGNCVTCKVKSYVNIAVKNDRSIKLYILNESNYVACTCRIDSSLNAGVLNAVNFNCRDKNVNIRVNIAVIATRTCVSCITLIGECRRSYNRLIVVTESRNNNCFSVEFNITYGTVNHIVIRACVYTIGSNVVFYNNLACGVTESVNNNCISADFSITYGTVNHIVIRACVYTIGSNVVFYNNRACGVTESINMICNVGVATSTSVGCITAVYTVGSSYNRVMAVNVSNNTECAVAIVGTIKCTVLTELRNVGSECTTGDNESCLSILVSLVHINVAVDETTVNITCTTYDTLIAGKVVVPVVDVKRCIILGCTVVYDITTYESECAVNTNGNLLICGDSTVTFESNILVDTNVEERITCVIVIIICGRNCLAVKINSEATSSLAVVSGLNVDISGNCDVRKKNYCIAVLCCIKCSLKCFISYVTDLCYCNECFAFGCATYRTGLGSIKCCIYPAVSELVNNLLCNGCIVTSCTVRAFGKTGFGTSGINRLVNYDVVAESLNLIATFGSIAVQYGIERTALFIIAYTGKEVNITSSAVPVCYATICSTGCINLTYLIKGMAICIDSLLCNENLVTYGTMLTFSKTGSCTSRSHCRVNHLGVNVSNNTECAVAIVGTIKCTVLTELRNVGSECTTGDNESCLSILVSLVHINVAVDETTVNITCTTYDTLIAGKVVVPVVDVKRCIILGCTVVYDITTYESECAVNTNGNLLICGDSTVTFESNILVDTNVEERITCVIVIIICGRNCLAVKINSEATSSLAVVSGLNVDISGNCDVRKKNYCIAVLCCIKCSLKCFISYVTDLCYCNECGNKVAIFGSTTAVCTGVNCVTLSIKCRSNYLACHHIVTGCRNNNCFSADLSATYGTVNYVIIRSFVFAVGGNIVFYNNTACSVALYRDSFLCNDSCATNRALLTIGKTGSCTSSLTACYGFLGVTESCGFIANVAVTTSTSVCCITAVYTVRSSYNCIIIVTGCGNFGSAYYLTTIGTSNGCRTCNCTCSIYGCCGCVGVRTLSKSMLDEPTALHLCITIIATNNTINLDGITDIRLGFHCIISCLTIFTVDTVNKNDVTICILNIYVTVFKSFITVELSDCTGNVVLVFRISICAVKSTELKRLCNSELGICCRSKNFSAVVVTLIILVCISVTKSRSTCIISSANNLLTISTLNNSLTCCCTCCGNSLGCSIAMSTIIARGHNLYHDHVSISVISGNIVCFICTNILCSVCSSITCCAKGILIKISCVRIILDSCSSCLSLKAAIAISEVNVIFCTRIIGIVNIGVATTNFNCKLNSLACISSKTTLTTVNRTIPIICGSVYGSLKVILTCTCRFLFTTIGTCTIFIVVSKSSNLIANTGITTMCTCSSSITCIITSRISYYRFIVMITRSYIVCSTSRNGNLCVNSQILICNVAVNRSIASPIRRIIYTDKSTSSGML